VLQAIEQRLAQQDALLAEQTKQTEMLRAELARQQQVPAAPQVIQPEIPVDVHEHTNDHVSAASLMSHKTVVNAAVIKNIAAAKVRISAEFGEIRKGITSETCNHQARYETEFRDVRNPDTGDSLKKKIRRFNSEVADVQYQYHGTTSDFEGYVRALKIRKEVLQRKTAKNGSTSMNLTSYMSVVTGTKRELVCSNPQCSRPATRLTYQGYYDFYTAYEYELNHEGYFWEDVVKMLKHWCYKNRTKRHHVCGTCRPGASGGPDLPTLLIKCARPCANCWEKATRSEDKGGLVHSTLYHICSDCHKAGERDRTNGAGEGLVLRALRSLKHLIDVSMIGSGVDAHPCGLTQQKVGNGGPVDVTLTTPFYEIQIEVNGLTGHTPFKDFSKLSKYYSGKDIEKAQIVIYLAWDNQKYFVDILRQHLWRIHKMTMALPRGTPIPLVQVMYYNMNGALTSRYTSVLLDMLDADAEEADKFRQYNVHAIVAAPKHVPISADAALLMENADSVVEAGVKGFGEVSPVCMMYNMAPPALHGGFSRAPKAGAAVTSTLCTPIALRRTAREMPNSLQYDRAVIQFPGLKAGTMDV